MMQSILDKRSSLNDLPSTQFTFYFLNLLTKFEGIEIVHKQL
jgi:hypothetical protein